MSRKTVILRKIPDQQTDHSEEKSLKHQQQMLLCVVRDFHCGKQSPHPSICVLACVWPHCLCMCVHALCVFVGLRVSAPEWPVVKCPQAKPQSPSPRRQGHAQLPEICPPTMGITQRTRILHTHSPIHSRAGRPGRDEVPGSRERGLDGKWHSFTCCYFQISVMAGLFWLLLLFGCLTNGDGPGADLRSPVREGKWKWLAHWLLWDQLEEVLFVCIEEKWKAVKC